MEPDEIRGLRRKAGLTEAALAKKLGVEPALVFQWERGERFPTKAHCDAMAKYAERAPEPPAMPAADPLYREVLADAQFQAVFRKILFHAELRAAVEKLAAGYADPAAAPVKRP